MRILYVCLDRGIPIGGTKGASIHMEELLRAFEAEGHETAVLARHVARAWGRRTFLAPTTASLRWVPGRVLRRDLREVAAGRVLRGAIREAVTALRPDLLYERYSLFRTEALSEAKRADLPHVLEVNAPLAWEERRFRGLALGRAALRSERAAWIGTDLVVVPSEPMARRVRATGQEHVVVVPNAVDTSRFSAHRRRVDLRSRLDLEGRFVVAFAGSLKPWHDLRTLVLAASALPARLRPALLVVGEGPERASLEREAGDLGLAARLVGGVSHNDVPEYLCAADVCVAGLSADPDLDYFSPLKAVEYLACGRPTVVAAAGDLGHVAEDGAALAYRPGDPRDLAARLVEIADDPTLAARLGTAGRTLAEARTWRHAARAVLQAADRLPRTASSV